ncbi:hypothetical protein EW145_g7093 [Phellinidium pouzarii]|uniref:Uncharacterized protein n=1 Tax=Phellinidium pouzarii TaxID=167371 RepID=A0A4S4KP57_9AGAM|nr:hypothetical protein EW145_g7093 [Phellinidium pouzarii]
MAGRSTSTVIASRSRCTLRCMPSSVLLACLLLLRARFKVSSGAFHSVQQTCVEHQQGGEKEQSNGRLSPKGAPSLRGVFQGPGITKRAQKLRAGKKHLKRIQPTTSPHSRGRDMKRTPSSTSESSSSGEASESESGRETPARASSPEACISLQGPECGGKGSRWHNARRRDARMNGADLWAGIKRIFHWDDVANQFDVVKVNSTSAEQYETHADNRLFSGLGW